MVSWLNWFKSLVWAAAVSGFVPFFFLWVWLDIFVRLTKVNQRHSINQIRSFVSDWGVPDESNV